MALWRDKRLLNWVSDSLELFPKRFLIAPQGKYQLIGFKNLEDTRPKQGPLAGLEAALKISPSPWVAFAGVDNPALNQDYWRYLIERWQPETLAIQACDATNRPQPLGALYHRQLLPHISQLLDIGERRLRLASPLEHITLVRDLNPTWFMNVNTVEDLGREP